MRIALFCALITCPLFSHPVKMVASWYGHKFAGRKMADTHRFDPERMTCAHKTFPLGTRLRISFEGKRIQVTVTDRGPYVPGRDLDLSRAAARMLGLIDPGVTTVEVEVAG